MVKVLPIEEESSSNNSNNVITAAEGHQTKPSNETQPNNDITAAVQQDEPPIRQSTTHATAGGSAAEGGEQSGGAVPDATTSTGPDASGAVMSQPETHTAGIDDTSNALDPSNPSASEELPVRVPGDTTPGAAGHTSQQDASPTTLDMNKHSGMTTFSLMQQHDEESSLDGPGPGPVTHTGQEDDDSMTEKLLTEAAEEEEEEPEPAAANFARRGTRKLIRQDTGIGFGGGMLGSGGQKKKKAPFHVPQAMYMGHPVGSPAAEFLEGQQHRLAQVKTRREEVAELLKLVMEHNPKISGSGLPDVDEVFPYMRGRENDQQGDRCI